MKSILLVVALVLPIVRLQAQPIGLHPQNPHYFSYKGKPTVFISSAEHYGAVLNLDVDYKSYLEVLANHGFNHTRVFSGVYCENNESGFLTGRAIEWNSVQNSLSPRPGKLITPWARSNRKGYANGGNKFDLDKWDESYFHRLKDFCAIAGQKGIMVELVLFTAFYNDAFWSASPLNPVNNINNTEAVAYNEFHLPGNKVLIGRQMKMVDKMVRELNEFDNVYFEICNEPYWLKGIPEYNKLITEQQFLPEINEWQALIARQIAETEKHLPKRHLIAGNIANTYYKIREVLPGVAVLNFHYAFPPATVTDNYHLRLPIVFDETMNGTSAPDRRKEAWAFILAGGAGYSNLDWSYATDDPTGLGRNAAGKRTSGKEVREQLRVLKNTMDHFDYIHAQPVSAEEVNLPEGLQMQGLKIPGKAYLYYFFKERKMEADKLSVLLDSGNYTALFIDPIDGTRISQKLVDHNTERAMLDFPFFRDDIVLKIVKIKNEEVENR